MGRRRKDGGPEILDHTSIRLESGVVLHGGDEAKLAQELDKKDLDRLQNEHGAIAGFVAEKKGAVKPPEMPDDNEGKPVDPTNNPTP